jgi:15-cis-phytoene synthase
MEALDWCRQRLLVPGNPLTASLLFAEADVRDAVLALRTVCSELASVASQVSERSLAETRLNWWRQALQDERNEHPAIKAMRETGASARIPAAAFEPLFAAIVETLDNPRFESTDQAWQFFRRAGGVVSELEAQMLASSASPAGVDGLADIGAAGYLIRVTRDLVIDARSNRWLVPLDVQADFQVARQDALQSQSSRSFDGMIRALLAEAVRRGERGRNCLSPEAAWLNRHQLILWALDCRLAGLIARRPQRIFDQRVLPSHALNVWHAWRAARRLRKTRDRAG